MKRVLIPLFAFAVFAAGVYTFLECRRPVFDKMNSRLYDARMRGLRSLSFQVRFEPAPRWARDEGVASLRVYWQSPNRLNVLPMDASGGRMAAHPYVRWLVKSEYLQKMLPIGLVDLRNFLSALPKTVTVDRVPSGRNVTVEQILHDEQGKRVRYRTVYRLDRRYTPQTIETYAIPEQGCPQFETPFQTVRFRAVDDGRVLFAESVYRGVRRRTAEYSRIGGYWLPSRFTGVEYHGETQHTVTLTFSKYEVNPELDESAFEPPQWLEAKTDLSTPEKSLRSLYDALYLGDLAKIRACLSDAGRVRWDGDAERVRRLSEIAPEGSKRHDWRVFWSGFIHGNAGKTSQIILTDRVQTARSLTARLRTVTTGRPVNMKVRMLLQDGEWRIDNSPDEIMRGYD